MGTFLFLIVIAAVLAAFLKGGKDKGSRLQVDWPTVSRYLLTRPEQVLYFRLVEALPEHLVFSQVQLSRILKIKKVANWRSWQNRIDRKSADFVVCRKDSSVLAVIELDDASHDAPDRRKADADKEAALSSAGIRLFRCNVASIPDVARVREQFRDLLNLPAEIAPTDEVVRAVSSVRR